MDKYLTTKEAAALTGVLRNTIQSAVQKGLLRSVRATTHSGNGGRPSILVLESDLIAYTAKLRKHRQSSQATTTNCPKCGGPKQRASELCRPCWDEERRSHATDMLPVHIKRKPARRDPEGFTVRDPPGRDDAIAGGMAAWYNGEYTLASGGGRIPDPRGVWIVKGPEGLSHRAVGSPLAEGERPVELHWRREIGGWEWRRLRADEKGRFLMVEHQNVGDE